MTPPASSITIETLEAIYAKFEECIALVRDVEDEEARYWLCELEGRKGGWFPIEDPEHEYLGDQVYLRLLDERRKLAVEQA